MAQALSIFWFRRDLRLHDNHGLYKALLSGQPVWPIFIFDTHILDRLLDKNDKRVNFIYNQLFKLKGQLNAYGSDLSVYYGKPEEIWEKLTSDSIINSVFVNHDYEKYAITRDLKIKNIIESKGLKFFSYKDQCIFEKTEVLSGSGTPYTVFTPYSNKWMSQLTANDYSAFDTKAYFSNFYKCNPETIIKLSDMGFNTTYDYIENPSLDKSIIENYAVQRDIPALKGTTRLSVHLRFGTVSVRECVKAGIGNQKWLNELIWRDFYMNILSNFPHINEGLAFRTQYDKIQWLNNEAEYKLWCDGNTGFPIVDAGMRELNTTGFMHNRVRMIVASFLCKDLLIDWRWGEAYFAQKLLDFDFSANNGGWQWASGSGCDAAPYFRVFNPDSQTLKFDKNLQYIKKWVPEYSELSYKPMVDHKMARERALRVYGEGLNSL